MQVHGPFREAIHLKNITEFGILWRCRTRVGPGDGVALFSNNPLDEIVVSLKADRDGRLYQSFSEVYMNSSSLQPSQPDYQENPGRFQENVRLHANYLTSADVHEEVAKRFLTETDGPILDRGALFYAEV